MEQAGASAYARPQRQARGAQAALLAAARPSGPAGCPPPPCPVAQMGMGSWTGPQKALEGLQWPTGHVGPGPVSVSWTSGLTHSSSHPRQQAGSEYRPSAPLGAGRRLAQVLQLTQAAGLAWGLGPTSGIQRLPAWGPGSAFWPQAGEEERRHPNLSINTHPSAQGWPHSFTAVSRGHPPAGALRKLRQKA